MKVANKLNINADTGVVTFPQDPTQIWKSDNQATSEASLHLVRFTLRGDVYNMLLADYTKAPLLLPVQCISYKDFNTAMGHVHEFGVTTQITFKRSNTGVVLFREDGIRSKQRFVNPCIRYQFAIGGLPNPIPSTHYSTIGDQRHTNLFLDACNVNNSKTFCIPDDVFSSTHRNKEYYEYTQAGPETGTKKYRWNLDDTRSFFIAIP